MYRAPGSIAVYTGSIVVATFTILLDRNVRRRIAEYLESLKSIDRGTVTRIEPENPIVPDDEVLQSSVLVKALFIIATVRQLPIRKSTRRMISHARVPMVLLSLVTGLICGCQTSVTRGTALAFQINDSLTSAVTWFFAITVVVLATL